MDDLANLVINICHSFDEDYIFSRDDYVLLHPRLSSPGGRLLNVVFAVAKSATYKALSSKK